MRQPPIVIHKGKKEEKYQLYVEDYVISFLKKREDRPEGVELNFYGHRDGRKYTVYGVGLDRHISDFDKYDLLDEICCQLTQQDPVFLIREEHGAYEIKGYEVFYCENKEMQDYLIEQPGFRNNRAVREQPIAQTLQRKNFSDKERKKGCTGNPHIALSLQLGLVFIVLVAIMINSANSYHKMQQLNQSAKEVFFVMENQEAEGITEEYKDVSVEREESLQDTVLQENALHGLSGEAAGTVPDIRTEEEAGEDSDPPAKEEGTETDETAKVQEDSGTAQTSDGEQEQNGERQDSTASSQEENGAGGEQADPEEEGVEALSRNVTRYYEVERGDTLYLISKKIYGDTSHVKKICELNQIADPDNIHYGQKIILP